MRLLLDTSVLIDALRHRRRRRELLADLVRGGHALTTSALNVAEVFAGMRSGEEIETEVFLEALECYDLTRGAAQLAGKLKRYWAGKGRTLTLADTFVAATALENGCVLMTDNGKDFPMPELAQYPLPS
jgi:predicted nucleic acid-binding protein